MTASAWINALLPPEFHRSVLRRLLIVWGVALLMALVVRYGSHEGFISFDAALVYSYAISTFSWFFIVPMRIILRRWLHTNSNDYWLFSVRGWTWVVTSILLGYVLGNLIGDAYNGISSFERIAHSPQRFWGFLGTSLTVSAGFLFYFYQREKALALESQATEARLLLLETQLEPHMLFNTLANLRALIVVDQEKAVQMLDRLNDYLRATLRASRSSETEQRPHTLGDEFARLSDYLALMAVRMGPRLRHTLTLPSELASHPLPPFLLQPLVENAIRHGLEPHIDGGDITISAEAQDTCLLLTVADTGAGTDLSPEQSASHSASGFGLAQVRERLKTAFGTCPSGLPRFQWHSAAGRGTRIQLRLPLQPTESTT